MKKDAGKEKAGDPVPLDPTLLQKRAPWSDTDRKDKADKAVQKLHDFRKNQAMKKYGIGIVGAGTTLLGMNFGHVAPTAIGTNDTPVASSSLEQLPASDGVCTMLGGSKKTPTISEAKQAASLLKNRFIVPAPSDFDANVKVDDFLAANADEKSPTLNQKKAVVITGYIVDVESGGAEICNCQTKDKKYWDTHIYISRDPGVTDLKECMIAEVTPRMRQVQRPGSTEWNTDQITMNYPRGTKVQIKGWEFYDDEHWPNALINPQHGSKVWRKSCWEVHPVTDIQKIGDTTSPGAGDND
jgi:hypothetical protein